METRSPCTNQCIDRVNNFTFQVQQVPLTIYNINHYHKHERQYKDQPIYTYSCVYLNNFYLFSLDRHWRPGEHLPQFDELSRLMKTDFTLEKAFSLYCQGAADLLSQDNFLFLHLMKLPWHYENFKECREDFEKAFNQFFRTEQKNSSNLLELEEMWKKTYLSIPESESFSSNSSSFLPNILCHPSA